MNDAAKFLTWCGLTCLGGSEKKECSCECPDHCSMRGHPDFATQRRIAGERLARCAANEAEARRVRGDFLNHHQSDLERRRREALAAYRAWARENDTKRRT